MNFISIVLLKIFFVMNLSSSKAKSTEWFLEVKKQSFDSLLELYKYSVKRGSEYISELLKIRLLEYFTIYDNSFLDELEVNAFYREIITFLKKLIKETKPSKEDSIKAMIYCFALGSHIDATNFFCFIYGDEENIDKDNEKLIYLSALSYFYLDRFKEALDLFEKLNNSADFTLKWISHFYFASICKINASSDEDYKKSNEYYEKMLKMNIDENEPVCRYIKKNDIRFQIADNMRYIDYNESISRLLTLMNIGKIDVLKMFLIAKIRLGCFKEVDQFVSSMSVKNLDLDMYIILIYNCFINQNFQKAEILIRERITINKTSPALLYFMGLYFIMRSPTSPDNIIKAKSCFMNAVKLNPRLHNVEILIGSCWEMLIRYKDAEKFYNYLLQTDFPDKHKIAMRLYRCKQIINPHLTHVLKDFRLVSIEELIPNYAKAQLTNILYGPVTFPKSFFETENADTEINSLKLDFSLFPD